MTNLPGVSAALRADVLTELAELLPQLQDRNAHAHGDSIRTRDGATMYETVAMRDARLALSTALRDVATAADAYRTTIRRAIDHLEAS